MGKSKFPKIKPISLVIQKLHIEKHFSDARTSIRRNCLNVIMYLQPSLFSCRYTVSLSYQARYVPRVKVLSPDLQLPERKSDVHVYKEGTLCLYYPGEWKSNTLIVNTIVPWISEWLLHYEIWEVTNKWHGGGIHATLKAS